MGIRPTRIIHSIIVLALAGIVATYLLVQQKKSLAPTTPDTLTLEHSENQVKGGQVTSPIPKDVSAYTAQEALKRTELTSTNVIWYTNYYRVLHGLQPLTRRKVLTNSAYFKSLDMFAHSYFDHTRPGSKIGFDYFIDNQKYGFIKVSENLAMGDFITSYEVVDAWMKSPEHRKNILDASFIDIGVSVDSGIMNGRGTTIITQHFGIPLNNCPVVDGNLQSKIESLRRQLATSQQLMGEQQTSIELMTVADPRYNLIVEEYNQEVQSFNAKLAEMNALVKQYNTQVHAFDACVARRE